MLIPPLVLIIQGGQGGMDGYSMECFLTDFLMFIPCDMHSHAFSHHLAKVNQFGMQLSADQQYLLWWHNIYNVHIYSHSHITNSVITVHTSKVDTNKCYIASPTRVTCSLHSYCWLHCVNYYHHYLFCGADNLCAMGSSCLHFHRHWELWAPLKMNKLWKDYS